MAPALALLLLLSAACAGRDDAPARPDDGVADGAAVPAIDDAPLLPSSPGRFAPSLADIEDGASGARVADPELCGDCHPDVMAQWRTSAHAASSFDNPIYRASVDAFRAARGAPAARFCGGCHDIALLADGALDDRVVASDPRAHAGVTCRVCHAIERATLDGNASYRLRAAPIELPRSGDPASVEAHKRSAAPLPAAELCAACHRAFLGEATGNGHFMPGTDDVGSWLGSVYAGSLLDRIDDAVEPRTCRGCHMPAEPAVRGDSAATDGFVSSHRVLGGHTWLAAMRGDDEQLDRVRAFLRGAATIDVAAVARADGRRVVPADGAELTAGERVLFEVVVRNLRVGHRFPGGTLDAQDTWIEVQVADARGAVLASAGVDHAVDFDDPTAHALRAVVIDELGAPALERDVHRFRTKVWDHTVGPRDAVAVQYAFAVPERIDERAWPLRVTARLRHRSRGLPLQRAACAASHSERGRAFARARRARGLPELDPCAPQPITDIAEATAELGAGAALPDDGDAALRRTADRSLAWLHVVQERAAEALVGLDRAVAAGGARGAAAAVLSAKVAARQGRVDDALRWLERAGRVVPGHPAIARARGDALAQVWRWSEASLEYARAAAAAPLDSRAWAAAAVAAGSAGDPAAALAAARRGLAVAPRDPDLLRAQAFALRALGSERAGEAIDAYVAHRRRDDAPVLRARCAQSVPACATERNPIHVHDMR